jgi:hypothetical protein
MELDWKSRLSNRDIGLFDKLQDLCVELESFVLVVHKHAGQIDALRVPADIHASRLVKLQTMR